MKQIKIRLSKVTILAILLFSFFSFGYAGKQDPLTIALTGKYPPFSFFNQHGKLDGFDVDIAKEIANILHKDIEIITTEWDGIIAGLLTNKYDAIIGSMAITPKRAEQVLFSNPYYISGAQLFVNRNNSIKDIRDCDGKKIGVVLGETYERYLRKNHSNIIIITYKSTIDIFQDMDNGRLDGFVTDQLVGAWQIKKANKSFIKKGDLLYKERIGIPVKKSDPLLLSQINKALAQISISGKKKQLYDKWFALKIEPEFTKEANQKMDSMVVYKKLLKGFSITLFVAFFSLLIGFIFALPLGVILHKKKGLIYILVRSGVDFIRGTPVLIQLFFVYYGAPQFGLTFSPLVSAIITLSINSMAYLAEVIRSGLLSVNFGQFLGGRALGLSKFQVFRFIIWPQAFRVTIPPLMNSIVALTKDTAIISVISVGEVIREAQSIISYTFNPMKYYLIVAIMFFIVTFPLMKLASFIECKVKEKGFMHD